MEPLLDTFNIYWIMKAKSPIRMRLLYGYVLKAPKHKIFCSF